MGVGATLALLAQSLYVRQPLLVECWGLPAESLSVAILSVACSFEESLPT